MTSCPSVPQRWRPQDLFTDTTRLLLRIGMNSRSVDWIGLDWIGLDWIGLDWIGLDWIASLGGLAAVGATQLYPHRA
jgi:hypothetical protein